MRLKKKDDEIRLIGNRDLGVLFKKVLQAGLNAGPVIIKGISLNVLKKFYVNFWKNM